MDTIINTATGVQPKFKVGDRVKAVSFQKRSGKHVDEVLGLRVTKVYAHEELVRALKETAYELAVLVGEDHSTVREAREALRKAQEEVPSDR